MDWQNDELDTQLSLQQIKTEVTLDALLHHLSATEAETVTILRLNGISDYANSWGDKAATWLTLAVVRMIREILENFSGTRFGLVPAHTFAVVCLEEDQQEIAHLSLTGYQEIYDVLLRTHRKPSSPIWHRRAVTQYFPQLTLDITNDDSKLDVDPDMFKD